MDGKSRYGSSDQPGYGNVTRLIPNPKYSSYDFNPAESSTDKWGGKSEAEAGGEEPTHEKATSKDTKSRETKD